MSSGESPERSRLDLFLFPCVIPRIFKSLGFIGLQAEIIEERKGKTSTIPMFFGKEKKMFAASSLHLHFLSAIKVAVFGFVHSLAVFFYCKIAWA